MDYKGATFQYTDYSLLSPKDTPEATPVPVKNASQEEITAALRNYGIMLPDTVPSRLSFRELSEEWYEPGWYEFTMDSVPAENGIMQGTLSCRYYGEEGFGSISDRISENKPYKKYPLLSEQEAYDQIAAGKFHYLYGHENLDIRISDCELIYVIDSKGFFQPTYEFSATVNGLQTHIHIPALKNKG